VTALEGRGVLDTSVVVAIPTLREPVISTVTLAELSVGPLGATTEGERAQRQRVLQQAESDVVALAFDSAAARTFGRSALISEVLAARRRRAPTTR
jgi:predicted nucleic acid-binding protein